MKKRILAIFTLAIVSLGAQTAQEKAPTALSSPSGRFVFGQVGPMRADQYMLDTETGRLWQIVVNSEGAKSLEPVPYYLIPGDKAFIPDTVEEAEAHKKIVRLNTAAEYSKRAAPGTKEEKK